MGLYKDEENLRLAHFLPAVVDWPVGRTSDPEGCYNCFAYVADDYNRIWYPYPLPISGVYWPTKVKPEEEATIWPFFAGYETLGFQQCTDGSFQEDLEKIALYVDDHDSPTHVAIQRRGGLWQSKLGPDIDIVHALESLASFERFEWKGYGTPRYFMSRKRPLRPVLP